MCYCTGNDKTNWGFHLEDYFDNYLTLDILHRASRAYHNLTQFCHIRSFNICSALCAQFINILTVCTFLAQYCLIRAIHQYTVCTFLPQYWCDLGFQNFVVPPLKKKAWIRACLPFLLGTAAAFVVRVSVDWIWVVRSCSSSFIVDNNTADSVDAWIPGVLETSAVST